MSSRRYPVPPGTKLTDLLPAKPPEGTVERIAWWLHVVGYLVPRAQRLTMFANTFNDNYLDFVESVPADQAFWPSLWFLHRHWALTCLSVAQCLTANGSD